MVEYPSEYPWSSYRYNALGLENSLITEHELYKKPGATTKLRIEKYQSLFQRAMPDKTIEEIRNAANKAWVMSTLSPKLRRY